MVTSSCPPSTIDEEYNNSATDPKCGPECTTCSHNPPVFAHNKPCNCSGCVPEDDAQSWGSAMNPTVKKKLPLNIRVTKDMCPEGLTILKRFHQAIWLEADKTAMGMLPPEAYLLSRDILTHLHSCLYHLKPTPTIPAPSAYIPTFLLISKSSKSTRTSPHYST